MPAPLPATAAEPTSVEQAAVEPTSVEPTSVEQAAVEQAPGERAVAEHVTIPSSTAGDGKGRPRVLVVVGHPLPGSLVHALADAYVAQVSRSAEVRVVDLATEQPPTPMSRDELRAAPGGSTDHLGPQVDRYVRDLLWADHLVVLHPQWWGTYPAVLKAWIDRTFLSGVAFRYRGARGWEKLLRGRTARLVMTMDSPRWWNRWVYRDAAGTSLRRAVLGYVGIRTVGTTRFSPVRGSSAEVRESWLATAEHLADADVRRLARRRSRAGALGVQSAPSTGESSAVGAGSR